MGYLGNSIASDGGSSKIAVFVVTKDGVIRRRAIIRSIVIEQQFASKLCMSKIRRLKFITDSTAQSFVLTSNSSRQDNL